MCILALFLKRTLSGEWKFMEFPGGLAVKVQHGHGCGAGVQERSLAWELPHATQEQPKKKEKRKRVGVPLWLRRLRIWCCHLCGSGHCCGTDLISGPGTSACHRCGQKGKKPRNSIMIFLLKYWLPTLTHTPCKWPTQLDNATYHNILQLILN